MWQANVLNFAGRPEEALRMVEQAMRLNPRYPPFYLFRLGWAYCLTGRYAEAVATLKESISRSPNYSACPPFLAVSYCAQWASQQNPDAQTLEQALAAAQRGIALNDSYPGVIYSWAMSICGKSSMSRPWPRWSEPSPSIPTEAEGYAGLAEALSRVGRSEEALGMVEQALRRKPFAADEHLNSVGAAYDLAGRPEEAIAPLEAISQPLPQHSGRPSDPGGSLQ